MPETSHVGLRLSRRRQIATLTLREPRLNLLSTPVLEELLRVGLRLTRMPALRLVVLTGAGDRAFIGGADIHEMKELNPESALIFIGKIHKFCHLLRTLPVPSIARVQG